MITDVLHYYGWEDKREIARRAFEALRPGGTIAVSKIRLDENGIEPASSSVLSLKMYAISGAGYLETDAEAVALLGHAGARNVQMMRLSEQQTMITGLR
jgi:8-O-methyltransferase